VDASGNRIEEPEDRTEQAKTVGSTIINMYTVLTYTTEYMDKKLATIG